MRVEARLKKWLVLLIGGIFLHFSLIAPTVQAKMIGTAVVVEQEQVELQRSELKRLLARDDIKNQLVAWGVDPRDAQDRVDSLNAQEVELMSQRMEELPAGGGVLGAVVFVFLVLLVTDILGFTNIFPFVRGVNN